MNIKSPEVVLKRPICTWLSAADYAKFKAVADSHGVTTAAYLRSIVVDVVEDDLQRVRAPERRLAVAG